VLFAGLIVSNISHVNKVLFQMEILPMASPNSTLLHGGISPPA
jgi:hypothetical protein